jgi:hypothetical protein
MVGDVVLDVSKHGHGTDDRLLSCDEEGES